MSMSQDLNPLLDKILKDLDKLVKAQQEEKVDSLQKQIKKAIEEAGEQIKLRRLPVTTQQRQA